MVAAHRFQSTRVSGAAACSSLVAAHGLGCPGGYVIFIHRPGIEPASPSIAKSNRNHWTTREILSPNFKSNSDFITSATFYLLEVRQRIQPTLKGEGLTQECEHQEAEIIE